jgi:hypothetical protein
MAKAIAQKRLRITASSLSLSRDFEVDKLRVEQTVVSMTDVQLGVNPKMKIKYFN